MAARGTTIRLADVAERAGVSLATASRSLTGTRGVSVTLAEHVREVATSMGYVTNMHARSLAGGGESSIGLIVSEIGDPYFAEIASGVIGVAAEHQRMVQISHAADPAAVLAQIRLLRAYRVGAIVLAGSGHIDPTMDAAADAELAAFQASGGRVAVVGRHHIAADAVLPDNVAAGRSIGQHLLELGHRRVALVAGPATLNTVADRLAGLREVLGDAVVSVSHQAFSRAGGTTGAAELLALNRNVTAIVGLSDVMAIGVLATLRERGIRVPEDVSVAGFDDISVAADLSPALTTARLPMAEIGTAALRLTMLDPASRPRRKAFSHELIVRESTGPPR
ncbi:LacI family DNA-binding transcriptional regulator [Glaciihabitans sp. UYNi722]|uniref:LacI family DNA-binding transcriptional regulator n=1 Tax=Glaciihabitans sp. UYNi722 TaxID=3156344 RepID=UPI0033950DBC